MQNRDMSKMLKWIALVIIAFGVVFSAIHIAEFNDKNLGLMIGIGFLVGGLQIWIFGVAAPLMQKMQDERKKIGPDRNREPV
ncbi:hypothetical protein [Cohnella algarum]|uniref:hypothetical protein n=1 Tax=Cohnella algarum TaxID=2044859 RepID=UPI001967CA8E|nr:hypothetical protein [Cohnella algarum]MBN2980788.1 hypothetical protein [Cohnella algarum]